MASYTKGRALVIEACRAAFALKWGAPTGTTLGKRKSGLPLTIHFKGGHRAVVLANMTFVLAPAPQGGKAGSSQPFSNRTTIAAAATSRTCAP